MTRLRALWAWLRRLAAALTPCEAAWRGAARGHAVMVAGVVLAILVLDVLPHVSLAKLAGFGGALGTLLLAGVLLQVVRWLLAIPSAAYRRTFVVLLPLLALALAPATGPTGLAVVAGALAVIAALIGGSLAILRRDGWHPRDQVVTLGALAVGLVGLIGAPASLLLPHDDPNPALHDVHLEDLTLDLDDPGAPGPLAFRTLTYGSGTDRHRPEFGADVDLVARSVDGSKLIDNWAGPGGWLRTRYWGFDDGALPLQGRAWVPDGAGPFPLVLMVHGNHDMEDFSDPGYAYLGEHLATRGILAVSVDENFLNGSTADLADLFGRPGLQEENDARGWLLLEHLRQWADWNDEPGGPLEGRVALDRVGLIGHSRGGEAVAVAAAFNGLSRYPDDATLAFDYGFGIRGVVAIAPADGQYEPRDRPTPLRGVSYLALQGSLDGDVTSFMGASQYSRVDVAGPGPVSGVPPFKSTLYVVGANHGQFNTTWGRNDLGRLYGWVLDTRPIMEPEAQRTVARVTIAAFFDAVLHDDPRYVPLFRDVRRAAAWLPDTVYVQRYADGSEVTLAAFEEDLDPATATLAGSRIEAQGLTRWREMWVQLKFAPLDTHAVVLAWDDRVGDGPAHLSITWPEGAARTGPETRLVFALSTSEEDTLPEGWADDHEDELGDDEDVEPTLLDASVVVTDAAGVEATLPLSHDRPIYPPIQAVTRRASFLEVGSTNEVLLDRHALPLADFVAVQPDLDPTALRAVRFAFDRSPRGAVVLDDLAFAGVPARDPESSSDEQSAAPP